MVMDLSQGHVSFKFAPQESFPLATVVLAGSCLNIKQAPDQPLIWCQLGKLSEEQGAQIHSVVVRYADVLTSQLGLTHLLEWEIQLKGTRPVKLSPYQLAPPKMAFLRDHIKKLSADGVIELPSSSYSSTMLLVPEGPDNFHAEPEN
jgi:hypothetical protein